MLNEFLDGTIDGGVRQNRQFNQSNELGKVKGSLSERIVLSYFSGHGLSLP